ncbi:hypothetical protein QJS66_12600 [Kocuria rhizophila]|nr:hypothetical protein QJS66_12600 [Kocuria rhizophila]
MVTLAGSWWWPGAVERRVEGRELRERCARADRRGASLGSTCWSGPLQREASPWVCCVAAAAGRCRRPRASRLRDDAAHPHRPRRRLGLVSGCCANRRSVRCPRRSLALGSSSVWVSTPPPRLACAAADRLGVPRGRAGPALLGLPVVFTAAMTLAPTPSTGLA